MRQELAWVRNEREKPIPDLCGKRDRVTRGKVGLQVGTYMFVFALEKSKSKDDDVLADATLEKAITVERGRGGPSCHPGLSSHVEVKNTDGRGEKGLSIVMCGSFPHPPEFQGMEASAQHNGWLNAGQHS